MFIVDDRPEIRAAKAFMEDKGYPNVNPISIERIEGMNCWYVQFPVPEGVVEIEVEHEATSGWTWQVSTFTETGL